MGDPLSISASIAALLKLTQVVVKFIVEVEGSSNDRNKTLLEVSSISGLLLSLQDLAARADDPGWLSTMKSLGLPGGPLEQLKSALEHLADKLAPARVGKRLLKKLKWPFDKREIDEILGSIERQKTMFLLAIQKDHIALSAAVQDDVLTIGRGVNELRLARKDNE
ncbi:MAG: hypothetical protein M1836_003366 [Candelina mexicana]|nr:MAG: hypothetical protein M1836_003366 [Candelina mexicana]